MPQSPDLRAQLENAVIRDLLGPANGPEEIVDERAVRERYLLGKLGPQGQSPLSGFDEILTVDDVEGELDLAGVAVLMRYTLRLLTGYALSINMELGVLI